MTTREKGLREDAERGDNEAKERVVVAEIVGVASETAEGVAGAVGKGELSRVEKECPGALRAVKAADGQRDAVAHGERDADGAESLALSALVVHRGRPRGVNDPRARGGRASRPSTSSSSRHRRRRPFRRFQRSTRHRAAPETVASRFANLDAVPQHASRHAFAPTTTMAGNAKKRETTNNDALGMSSTERILKRIHELYEQGLNPGTDGSLDALEIAGDPLLDLSSTVHKPRKKVNVMIIGNHSAGKSSFINWYIGESVQTTGVAIETRGFTFVTSGRKRETLKGDATFAFYDHIEGLQGFKGITDNVFTEISTSKDKNFSCVELVDTPGLVDGEMEYPFDVVESIVWLADHVDLILVFFDPIGQALCKRTMTAIERLNESHAEKLAYYMSKADQVEKEHDRQRVLIQITQNLAGRVKNFARVQASHHLPSRRRPRRAHPQRPRGGVRRHRQSHSSHGAEEPHDDEGRLREDRLAHRRGARDEQGASPRERRPRRQGYGLLLAQMVVAAVLAYVVATEMCALGPVATAVRTHVLPALGNGNPVLREVVEGTFTRGRRVAGWFGNARAARTPWRSSSSSSRFSGGSKGWCGGSRRR